MTQQTHNYGMITDPAALEKLVGKLLTTRGPIGYDVETGYHGPDREKGALFPQSGAFICGFSFTNDPRWARYVPVRHDLGPNMDPDVAFEIMEPLLTQEDEEGRGRIVPHHEKFERRFTRREGIEIAVLTDTMIESYCLSETKGHGLKDLTKEHFGHEQAEIHSLFPEIKGKAKKAIRFNILELTPEVVAYACEDAAWAVALTLRNLERVRAERKIPFELDMELSAVIADMEDWGVAVDWEGLGRARAEAEPFAARFEMALKDELGRFAGRDLRGMKLNSTLQLRQLLYEDLGLPVTRMTNPSKTHPDGQPSTDAVALERLAKENEAIRHLLELREVNNLVKRFEKWESYHHAEDDRVHPSYGMVTVGTARFAANDPPIQQCPKDWYWSTPTTEQYPEPREWKGNFRKFITVDPDHYYLGFDYSQIELRVMAGLSGEPSLMRAFEEDEDVHTLTAAMMLGKRPEDVDPKTERPIGKAQPVDEVVLTPQGFVGMGDVCVGDELVGSDGTAVRVSGVYPQGVRPTYRVTFSDGSSALADAEHMWTVTTQNDRNRERLGRTMTTLALKAAAEEGRSLHLPVLAPVEFPEREDLVLDPWLVGALLGDGSMSTHGTVFSCGEEDAEEMLARVRDALPEGVSVKGPVRGSRCDYRLSGDRRGERTELSRALKALGMKGCVAETKRVPERYLLAPVEVRLSVLQGLMDTDGHAGAGSAEFSSASEGLAEDVAWLARSLGGRARVTKKETAHQPAYRVVLHLPSPMNPFSLSRKVRGRGREPYRSVRSVEYVGEMECRCVSVEAPDHLYVTRDFVLTHNTMNFALLYGMGVKSLSDRLALSRERAAELYDGYFRGFPSIRAWMDRMKAEGRVRGSTLSWIGRKYTVWELGDSNPGIVAKGERVLVNAPVQGGAADYMRLAMVRAARALRKRGWWGHYDPETGRGGVRMIMNQHDALGFEVHSSIHPREAIELLQAAVVFPVKGFPTIKTDWEIGVTWGGASEIPDWQTARFEKVESPRGGEAWVLADGRAAEGDEVAPETSIEEPAGEETPEPDGAGEEREEALAEVKPLEEARSKREKLGEERDAFAATDAFEGEGQEVEVRLKDYPTAEQWGRFLEEMRKRPGPNAVTVVLPEGERLEDLPPTGLSKADASTIALILPGAETVLGAASVADVNLMEGMSL